MSKFLKEQRKYPKRTVCYNGKNFGTVKKFYKVPKNFFIVPKNFFFVPNRFAMSQKKITPKNEKKFIVPNFFCNVPKFIYKFYKIFKEIRMFGANFQTLGHCKLILGQFLFLDKNKYPPC